MKFIKEPINQFVRLETSSSIILFFSTVLALILANSPASESFLGFWENKITISLPGFELSKPILKWINDGLMAIFFFLIGLEIKREILIGELNEFKKASLPFFAAIGGMIIPAMIFLVLNKGNAGSEGWGIPMAADIAFTLGILKLLGNKVPNGLKIFLMAFAIIDDLGAVLIIAFFYSSNLVWAYIGIAIGIIVFLFVLSYKEFYSKYFFFILGVFVWILFLKSGIHATIAGVLMALTIPIKRKTDTHSFYKSGKKNLEQFLEDCKGQPEKSILTKKQLEVIDKLEEITEKTAPPLQYLEHRLHGWVSYIIMPLFALANAGVIFNFSGDTNFALSINIAISLIVGNALGIIFFSFLSVKLNLAELPLNVSFKQIIGLAFLGGLGFTMSLFINNLAYSDPILINSAKMGILIGSFIAGLLGFIILKIALNDIKN